MIKMNRGSFAVVFILLNSLSLAMLVTGCSSNPSTSPIEANTNNNNNATDASIAYPKGLAVASLVAAATPVAVRNQSTIQTVTFDSSLGYKDKVAHLNQILSGTTAAECAAILPNITPSAAPSCYGPTLYYQNHPNGSDAPGFPGPFPQLPSGDLGIWNSTDTNGEACVAAKLNQLTTDLAKKEDMALLLGASMICLMKVSEKDLPETVSSSVDLTSELNSAISTNNSFTTITSASVERLADLDSHPVYKISIAGTISILFSHMNMTFNLKHMPTTSDNSTYQGRIWGSITGLPLTGDPRQANAYFTLGYERTSSLVKSELHFTGTASTISESQAIGTDGSLNWSNIMASNGTQSANIQHSILNVDPTTGTGSVSYSWQAGGGDSATRVFNAYTTSSSNVTSGCGFFGFGEPFSTTGAPNNSINKFICNWAGPGNNHAGLTSYAQKQCMTQDLGMGHFVPNVSQENITYAPVNSCSVASGGTFQYGTSSNQDLWTKTSSTAVTHNLIHIETDPDYANYSAPSAPHTP